MRQLEHSPKSEMSGFRRSYSRVWWASYFHNRDDTEDEHEPEVSPSSLPPSLQRFNRRRSSGPNRPNNNRNSSSSPSNGSQKSQDSGFSDSESSSPSSCSSKTINQDNHENVEILEEETSIFNELPPRLPQTPINRIPRLLMIKSRQYKSINLDELREIENDQSNKLTNTYLTDCYFPMTNLIVGNKSGVSLVPHANQSSSTSSCSSTIHDNETYSPNVQRESSYSPQSPYEMNSNNGSHRTCFIVDEIRKNKSTKNETSLQNYSDTNESTTDTSFSLSYDNTVRYVEQKKGQMNEEEYAEMKSIPQPSNSHINTIKILTSNESILSNPELSHLPEPTFTSTPKKEDLSSPRKINKKIRNPSFSEENTEEKETVKFVDPPVGRWLLELQYHYETECMTTLQAKRIPQYYKKRTSDILMVSESGSSQQIFQEQTKIIANEFLNLYESINLRMCEVVKLQLSKLIISIKEFILNYSQLLPRMEAIEKENVLKIMDMCDYFQKLFNPFDQQTLLNELNLLEKFFSRFVDSILVQQVIILISELDEPNSEMTLLTALQGIATLNLNTSRTLDLVTRLDGIRKLLMISLQSNSSIVRKAAMRSLTIICQNASSIREFEKARGVEIISEILCDVEKDETELIEIVSILVQITAPWIEDDHIIKGLIYHLYPVLNALTRLIITTSSCETLLLCAAALANISFIEPQAVFVLVKLDTAGYLLTSVRKLGVKASIFLQEQVATLIANIAAESETRTHLAQHRAVGALLCFLQVKHFPLQTDAEIAAAERLQHKAAVALSRLCSNPEIAKQVVELQGVNRLVRLCREERERNYSDGVLVACLTSLRKITANCGNDSIISLNAKELVEPRLVDSFLMYSSKQESYV